MKFYQSIRFRIVASILLAGSLLIILNGGITFFIMGKNLSRLMENILSTEMEYFLYKYEKDRATPLAHSRFIRVYENHTLPPRIKDQVRQLPPGTHTIFRTKPGPPIHVGVMVLPDKETPYYMVFQGKDFFKENAFLNPKQILMLSLAILLIPGIFIGYFTSKMLFAPVVKLMDKIKGLNPENIPTLLSDRPSTNEIGVLTQTLETTMFRIRKFIAREKQFTRDASHELRTPLTIVKGAVEIMEQQPEMETNPLLKRPLKRISRSVTDMESTIETFLWLAREEIDTGSCCQVGPVIQKAVSDNEYLIRDKDISLHVDISQDITLNVQEEILHIAVANLVRNAFHFTTQGSVAITLYPNHLEIKDTGIGIDTEQLKTVTQSHIKGEASQGFGLGLSIVSRLCKRFGWDLTIDSEPQKGTQVKILWTETENRE